MAYSWAHGCHRIMGCMSDCEGRLGAWAACVHCLQVSLAQDDMGDAAALPPGLMRGASWNPTDALDLDAPDQQESIMTPTRSTADTHTLSLC